MVRKTPPESIKEKRLGDVLQEQERDGILLRRFVRDGEHEKERRKTVLFKLCKIQ